MENRRTSHNDLHPLKSKGGAGKILAVIIVILIIIGSVYLYSGSSGTKPLGQNYTFTLAKGSTQNFVLNDGRTFSVYLNSSSALAAYLEISQVPIFPNQIISITLSKGQTVNVSLNGSQYSDIELKSVSSNNTAVVLSVIQIPKGIKVPTGSQQQQNTTTVTATGTTTAQTTAPTPTANTTALAQQAFGASNVGTLINNYAVLYKASSSCTPSDYNSSFIASQNHAPTGPNTYYNVSRVTPYAILSSGTEVSSGTYNFTYTTVSKVSSSNVLTAQFSYPSNVVVSYKFTGIFSGMTYSQVLSNYDSQNSTGSSCGVLVP